MTELRAKRRARIRDGFACQFCGSQPGAFRLHGHHVRPKSLYPDLAAEVSNLITLCMICHIWTVHSSSPADGGKIAGNWKKFVFVCSWLIRRSEFRYATERQKALETLDSESGTSDPLEATPQESGLD